MGKRKLHDKTYYQCDWTALPMDTPACYMPTFEGKKLKKRGNYCNWESVVAHADHLHEVEKKIETEEYEAVLEHVYELTGSNIQPKDYHFTMLEHFPPPPPMGSMYVPMLGKVPFNSDSWHMYCNYETDLLSAVKITPNGEVYELMMDPNGGEYNFEDYLTRPYSIPGDPETKASEFAVLKKGRIPKDRELVVHYWAGNKDGQNGLAYNLTASTMFKVQICGDALITLHTKEICFKPRKRYINFTKQNYDEVFASKKKRAEKKSKDVPAVSTADYEEIKGKMDAEFAAYEAEVSKDAELPGENKGASMPPPSGKELAALMPPPPPKPPSLARQVSVMG